MIIITSYYCKRIFTIQDKFSNSPIINVSDGYWDGIDLVHDMVIEKVNKSIRISIFCRGDKTDFCFFAIKVPFPKVYVIAITHDRYKILSNQVSIYRMLPHQAIEAVLVLLARQKFVEFSRYTVFISWSRVFLGCLRIFQHSFTGKPVSLVF